MNVEPQLQSSTLIWSGFHFQWPELTSVRTMNQCFKFLPSRCFLLSKLSPWLQNAPGRRFEQLSTWHRSTTRNSIVFKTSKTVLGKEKVLKSFAKVWMRFPVFCHNFILSSQEGILTMLKGNWSVLPQALPTDWDFLNPARLHFHYFRPEFELLWEAQHESHFRLNYGETKSRQR